jgi:hypothetical protein
VQNWLDSLTRFARLQALMRILRKDERRMDPGLHARATRACYRGGERDRRRGRRVGGRGAGTRRTQRLANAAVNPVGQTVRGSALKLS